METKRGFSYVSRNLSVGLGAAEFLNIMYLDQDLWVQTAGILYCESVTVGVVNACSFSG